MNNPITLLAARVGVERLRTVVAILIAAFLFIGIGVTVIGAYPLSGDAVPGVGDPIQEVTVANDTAGDGLPDALANRIGARVDDPYTLGQEVPDGWIYHWYGESVDWDAPAFLNLSALSPPSHQLPQPLQDGGLELPTIAELYHIEAERRAEEITGAWWLVDEGLNPRSWDNDGDDIADAWLVQHGLNPLALGPEDPAPGDPQLTVIEKYERGLNPARQDTAGNGLRDIEELRGRADLAGQTIEFEQTDPRAFSTGGSGIADGYLVRFGLDPHDATVGGQSPAGDGLTVRETYDATLEHCRDEDSQGQCDWWRVLDEGPVVDPTRVDSNGDGVPDAWSLRDPHGVAHPLVDAREHVVYDTTEWDANPWDEDRSDLSGVVIDDDNPEPSEPYEVTVWDLYAFDRPTGWDEETDGPWWGGLPTRIETGEDMLPPAVALRGWNVTVDATLGEVGQDVRTLHGVSDPRNRDSTGDGLLDIEQYFGVNLDTRQTFPRSLPDTSDTDGDGLTDEEEINLGTGPLRRDSSRSFLTDGQEFAYWNERYEQALETWNESRTDFRDEYAFLAEDGQDPTLEDALALRPEGKISGNTSNILSRSASGDGLPDGVERFPNRFFIFPTALERPSTDPARIDTSGDGLPDEWKIQWSQDEYYECKSDCSVPVEVEPGTWPLDPSKKVSIPALGVESDAEANLAADRVRPAPGEEPVEFTNRLAFRYDLHPYIPDSSDDGISDMFAIHWGIENVPQFAKDTVADNPGSFEWARTIEDELSSRLTDRGFDPVETAIINPSPGAQEVTLESNLLATFSDRSKGVWIYDQICDPEEGQQTAKDLTQLGEQRIHYGEAETDLAFTRGWTVHGLKANEIDACWVWHPYPVGLDIDNDTNPWRHDSTGLGIPDAWKHAYGLPLDASPGRFTPGSLESGCEEEDACLTLLQAYRFGLDPIMADTSGGGFEDWRGLLVGGGLEGGEGDINPLDPRDDAGHEDWDGTGILNWVQDELGLDRMNPDTSGSGLLDSDHLGIPDMATEQGQAAWDGRGFLDPNFGDGDLCIPGPDLQEKDGEPFDFNVALVPNMDNRPGGALTYAELVDMYIQRGVLFEEPGLDNACPEEYYLFKREGMLDQTGDRDVNRGTGFRSDPTLQDSSGEGIPDGWLAYWRETTTKDSTRTDLEPWSQKKGSVAEELWGAYSWGMPADWDPGRDGPWWGGHDPTTRDTAGDEDWIVGPDGFAHEDGRDHDLDKDGIPREFDPHPALDPDNVGIVQWVPQDEAYHTDYLSVWEALETRDQNQFQDHDDDTIPDFLDRARTRIVDVEVHGLDSGDGQISMGGTFEVEGRVLVDETTQEGYEDRQNDTDPASAPQVPVEGATVQIRLWDEDTIAIVGAGVTDEEGRFAVTTTVTSTVEGSVPESIPGDQVSIAGQLYAPEDPFAITDPDRNALELTPGSVDLRVLVEPNARELQPLRFHDDDNVHENTTAYRSAPFCPTAQIFCELDGNPEEDRFPIFGANVLDCTADGCEPEDVNPGVTFTTNAIFANVSAPSPLTLFSPTVLTFEELDTEVTQGGPINATGTYADAEGNLLSGYNVTLSLVDGDEQTREEIDTLTDDEGRYAAVFSTQQLAPGGYHVQVIGELRPGDEFLEEPEPITADVTLTQDTFWRAPGAEGNLLFEGVARQNEEQVVHDAAAPMTISARLLDHHEQPIPNRDVEVRLEAPQAGLVVHNETLATDQEGILTVTLDPIAGTPPTALDLRLIQEPLTQADEVEPAYLSVAPRFETVLSVEDVTLPIGATGHLNGTLTLSDGTAVDVDTVPLLVEGPDGDELLEPILEEGGTFRVPVHAEAPIQHRWTLRFLGDAEAFLQPSAPAQATSTHTSNTQLTLETPEALVGHETVLTGTLTLPDGTPIPNATLNAGWAADETRLTSHTDANGTFEARLLAPTEPGPDRIEASFSGTSTLHPQEASLEVTVKIPTKFDVEAQNITLAPSSHASSPLFEAKLTTGDGDPLAGRGVRTNLTGPLGESTILDLVADDDGAFGLTISDVNLERAGLWTLSLSYEGTELEAATRHEQPLPVRHLVHVSIDRAPSSALPYEMVTLQGSLEAPFASPEVSALTLTHDRTGSTLSQTQSSGATWRLPFEMPLLPRGTTTFTVNATEDGFTTYRPDGVEMRVDSGVNVTLTEDRTGDGLRVEVLARDEIQDEPVSEAELVLARTDEAGQPVATLRVVTDESGYAEITDSDLIGTIDTSEAENLSVLSITEPGVEIAGIEYQVREAAPVAPQEGFGAWTPVVAGLALLVALIAGGYVHWLRRHRRALREGFEDARRALLDPTGPPLETIQLAYLHLEDCLAEAGYEPGSDETVRDVTRAGRKAFRLPLQAMNTLADLFEMAVYGGEDLTPEDRDDAVDAFTEIILELGADIDELVQQAPSADLAEGDDGVKPDALAEASETGG